MEQLFCSEIGVNNLNKHGNSIRNESNYIKRVHAP